MTKKIEEILTKFEGSKVFTVKNTKQIMAYVRRELMECYEKGFNQGYEKGLKKNKRFKIF